MALNLNLPESESHLTPKITVIGVGGAGGNAVNNMIQANLEGVDFLVANTDAQALAQSLCQQTVQIGRHFTQGLGAGSQPDVGRAAAEEALDEILAALEGVNMVFIAAGMGGGTGTGAAPVIARATREAGILTVGVCTKPFQFEGIHRMRIAESGLNELQQFADTLIIIPNQNLFRVANEKTTFADAFKMADDVLHAGVRGVTDLIVMPGLINLDFADIRAVMSEMGKAMMGTGEAEGEHRAIEAAEAAISNPLLDEVSMKGARGVLINITGGDDLTLFEVDEAANRIRDEVDPEANIIFGSTFEQAMSGNMRVSVVATGIEIEESVMSRPVPLSLVAEGKQAARSAAGISQGSVAEAIDEAAEELEAAKPEMPGLEVEEQPGPIAQQMAQLAAEAEQFDEPLELVAEAEDDHQIEEKVAGKDAFIAPPAAQTQPRAEQPVAARNAQADPFAAAELPNSGQQRVSPQDSAGEAPARRKSHSLLAKVTGAARAFHEVTQSSGQQAESQGASQADPDAPAAAPQPKAPAVPRPRAGNARITRPATPQKAAAPSAAPEAQAEPASKQGQPRLTGLDPAERLGVTPSEEDLLDIPAFLRRQAN